MAAALVVPASLIIGQALTVTGTGFDDTETMLIKIQTPDESVDVQIKSATSGGGALDMSAQAIITPQEAGIYTVTVTDSTDSDEGTLTATCEVFAS